MNYQEACRRPTSWQVVCKCLLLLMKTLQDAFELWHTGSELLQRVWLCLGRWTRGHTSLSNYDHCLSLFPVFYDCSRQ